MEVGYLPDMFGHVAQMPQILRLAGFEHAVVWRGVPSAVTKTGFRWEAPDGSAVRAEYLPVGYGNGAVLPDDAKALVRRIEDHEHEIGSFLLGRPAAHERVGPPRAPALAGAGGRRGQRPPGRLPLRDHLAPRLPGHRARRGARALAGRAALGRAGQPAHGRDLQPGRREAGRGPGRAAARAPGRALRRPLLPEEWPARLLELAWLEVVRNAAHDSICACSVDDVVDAVLHRYAEARQIGEGLAGRALGALARSMAAAGAGGRQPVGPGRGRAWSSWWWGPRTPPRPTCRSSPSGSACPGSMTLDAETVRTMLGMLQGPKIDNDAWVQDIVVEEDDTGIDLTVSVGPEERPNVPIAEVKQDLYTRLGARPDVAVRVRLDQPPIRRIAARVAEVPGFGWRALEPVPLAHPVTVTEEGGPVTMSNGLVTVVVDPAAGTFSVDGLGGFGRLVDGGDLGDSYNYSPPRTDSLVEAPEAVSVSVGLRGPVRATRGDHRHLPLARPRRRLDPGTGRRPRGVGRDHGRAAGRRAAGPGGHLLRQPRRATTASGSTCRCPDRPPPPRPSAPSPSSPGGSRPRGGRTSSGSPPSRPGGSCRPAASPSSTTACSSTSWSRWPTGPRDEVALTLLRSTGMLSRLGMAYRPFPAGPLTPVDGLQLVGRPIEARYALAVGEVDPWAMADDVLLPLEVVQAQGGGLARARGQRARGGGGRGLRGAPRGRAPRGPGPQSRPAARRRCRPPAARAGSSTCGAGRSSRSTGASSYAPSASPPSASLASEVGSADLGLG